MNILSFVLDDDEDILMVVEDLLKEHGITDYRLFTHEKDFLRNLTADIHVCIIDHYLQNGMTGLDVCRAIKQISKDSFVIIVTGLRDPDVIIEYLNECADKFVDKNRRDHLELLIRYMNVGLEAAKSRLAEIQILQRKRKEIQERRKKFEP